MNLTSSLSDKIQFFVQLEGTARYAGLFLAPAEGFDFRLGLFLPFILLSLDNFMLDRVNVLKISNPFMGRTSQGGKRLNTWNFSLFCIRIS